MMYPHTFTAWASLWEYALVTPSWLPEGVGIYFIPFFVAFLISLVIIPLVCRVVFKIWPQMRPAIRFGGVIVILVFLLVVFLDKNLVIDRAWWGVILGSLVILIYGLWDDIKDLKPGWQLLFQVLAILIIVAAGVRVDYITNPFGGAIRLDQIQLAIGNQQLAVFGSFFILFWLILIMNAVNWLDGIDGLAGGVSLVGFVVIFFLSISKLVNQPPIGIVAAILIGAVLGFLIHNFPRPGGAKILLGTSGSIFLGFMLATLSIFSGSKIATALLVLSIPVLDAFWVIWHRLRRGQSIFKGDKTHLHHRLLCLCASPPKIALSLIALSAIIGVISLLTSTLGKTIALIVLLIIVLLFFGRLEVVRQVHHKKS